MLKTFFHWLEDRTGVWTLLKKIGNRPIPLALMNLKMWPAVMFFLLMIQFITGFILWLHYSPSTQTAYESVFFIQYSLWGGWLLRGIHHFSAQLLVGCAIIYILYQIVRNTYRAPREVVFWLSLILFFWGLGACLTGDLLCWDQNSYGATQVRIKYLTQIPLIGNYIYALVTAGETANSFTLTRFTALHIGVFGGGMLVLMLIHAVCDARAETKILREALLPEDSAAEKTEAAAQASLPVVRWWDTQALMNAVACLVMMFFVLYLVSHGSPAKIASAFPCEKVATLENPSAGLELGVHLGPPADTDPTVGFNTARPEWTFRGLYQYTLNFSGKASEFVLIFIVPSCVLAVFFLMPFIGRVKWGYFINLGYAAVLCVVLLMLTQTSYKKDAASVDFQTAKITEREEALRVYQLTMERGGLSPGGALNMLKSDWVTQGPKLYAKHCVTCHPFTPGLMDIALESDGMQKGLKVELSFPTRKIIPAQSPLAPNLYEYPSREWIAGIFDAKSLTSDRYYGKTALKNGSMATYVAGNLKDYLEDESLGTDGLNVIIDALHAESQLAEPRPLLDSPESDEFKKLPQGISEDTMFMLTDFGCTGCHVFYDQGTGGAPNLTAYGSPWWTRRVIADPTKFYPKNDRMLAYHPETEGSDKNLMTAAELDMLVKWLYDGATPKALPAVEAAKETATVAPVETPAPAEAAPETTTSAVTAPEVTASAETATPAEAARETVAPAETPGPAETAVETSTPGEHPLSQR